MERLNNEILAFNQSSIVFLQKILLDFGFVENENLINLLAE